jgi:F-type H+-transporting ATPase subunit b
VEGLGINLGYLLVQIFNFAIMFVVLKEWAYKPILKMLDGRRATIEKSLEDARVAAEARANAEKEAERIVAEAQAKAGQIVRDATERAEEAARDVRTAAEAEAAKIRESALADVESERNRILADMRGQVAALAMAAAQKLVGDALDEKRQRALLDEFFAGVKSGKVTVLDDAELKGAEAEVVSALPLTDAEKETVKKDVLAKTGAEKVTFRVDPSILGGIIIKVGDQVVDGSMAGQLESLRQSLR